MPYTEDLWALGKELSIYIGSFIFKEGRYTFDENIREDEEGRGDD